MATNFEKVDDFQEIEEPEIDYINDINDDSDPDEKSKEETLDVDADWLDQAGFGVIVDRLNSGSDVADDDMENLTSTLTKKQANVLKKRVSSLTATLRSKKPHVHTDVRDIFPVLQDQNTNTNTGSLDVINDDENNYHFKLIRNEKSSNDLPDCQLHEEDIIWLDNISKTDIAKLQTFAFLQLSVIFDENHIYFRKGKSRKKKTSNNKIFGNSLQNLYDKDSRKYSELKVPLIYKQMIDFLLENGLKDQGILRVAGSQARIKQYRQVIELKFPSGQIDLTNLGAKTTDVSSLLKQFLRELQQPLLTYEFVEAFWQLEELNNLESQLQALMILFILLPSVHRESLKMLLNFLNQIVKNHDKNLMSLDNVVTIISPNLFNFKSSINNRHSLPTPTNASSSLSSATTQKPSKILRLLITYNHLLGIVPAFLFKQIRPVVEKRWTRLFKFNKKDKNNKPKNSTTTNTHAGGANNMADNTTLLKNHNEIIIQNGLSKINVHLTNALNAGQVVKQFQSSFDSSTKYFLYEKGGNINCRRLNNNCKLLNAFRDNPLAEWILSSKPPVEF